MIAEYHGPENPILEATDGNKTLVKWQGGRVPRQIADLNVGYCRDGMMRLGDGQMPIMYKRVQDTKGGCEEWNIMELDISLAGLGIARGPDDKAPKKSDSGLSL